MTGPESGPDVDDQVVPAPSPVPLLVIGCSAGSLAVLTRLVNGLPADLDAAVLVCQHTPQDRRSRLPEILARKASLPVAWALDREPLQPGRVYVAPPGRHLLVHGGTARVSSGPRVNRHRPSVDVLFASAAQAAGPATTAVVLSGVLDDGAVGAALVDLVGGRVWVQDPASAEFGNMPAAALAAAPGASIMDDATPVADLVASARRRSSPRRSDVRPATAEEETVATQNPLPDGPGFLEPGETRTTRIACPDCGGGLAQVDLPRISYFRCHVGHQYGPQSLAAAQAESVERKLWSAVAALEEQAAVAGYLEDLGLSAAPDPPSAGTFRRSAVELTDRARSLREQVQRWAVSTDLDEADELT